MEYTYAAIIRKSDDKMFAEAVRIPAIFNLASLIRSWDDLDTMMVCKSRKEAIATAHAWEDAFIANGTAWRGDRNWVTSCRDYS